jgi:hypothetical protein
LGAVKVGGAKHIFLNALWQGIEVNVAEALDADMACTMRWHSNLGVLLKDCYIYTSLG